MNKYLKLIVGVICDAIGYVSYVFPGFGEVSDVFWAPLSGWIMTKVYKGKTGRIAGVATFAEEILPFSDVIPTFTLMWMYTYLVKKDSKTLIDLKKE